MFSNFIWFLGIGLEVSLLIRAAVGRLFGKYPLFYSYVGCVFLKEMAGLLSFTVAPRTYELVYWPSELATIVASFAILIEIFRESGRQNPGVVRFGQNFLLIALGITSLYAYADFSHHRFRTLYGAIVELDRDLRLVEGALLIVLLWLFIRYRITFGRNLAALVLGYSFWIGVNLIDFAFWYVRGNEASVFLRNVLRVSYTVTLAFWVVMLWSLQEKPHQENCEIGYDYEFIAAKIRAVVARTSYRLVRAIRP